METVSYQLKDITLLITHYNRSNSLENLLKKFEELHCSFGDIIVSDDGSESIHQAKLQLLKEKYAFRLILASKNSGLGNNINKGQDAVKTPYTLYVQEDFLPQKELPKKLVFSLSEMKRFPSLDIIRFYSYRKYPYLKDYKEGFSEMYIPSFATKYKKIYYYSDHPHLRRSTFFEKFGRYKEGVSGDNCEYRMCVSFIKNKGKGLFFNDFKSLFDQVNSIEEPSTMNRVNWRKSNNPIIGLIRDVYRQIKYNADLYLK